MTLVMKKFTTRLSWKPKPNRKLRFFLQNLPKLTDRKHFGTVTTLCVLSCCRLVVCRDLSFAVFCLYVCQGLQFLTTDIRDVNQTLACETRPIRSVFGPFRPRWDWDQDLSAIPRDRDIWFLPRDETETETLQGWDRDVFWDLHWRWEDRMYNGWRNDWPVKQRQMAWPQSSTKHYLWKMADRSVQTLYILSS